MAGSPAWQEQDNCLRCCKLTLDGGGYFSKQLLLQETVNKGLFNNVDAFLATKKKYIIILKARKKITDIQYFLMFPKNGTPTNLKQWDITLVTLILTNVVTLNQGQKDAIRDVRELRNTVNGHRVHLALTETIFQTTWANISSTLTRLSLLLTDQQCQTAIADMIDSVKHEALSSDIVMKLMKEWHESDKKVEESIGELGEEMKSEISSVKQIVKNIEGERKRDNTRVENRLSLMEDKIESSFFLIRTKFYHDDLRKRIGDVGNLLERKTSITEKQQSQAVDQMKMNRKLAEAEVRLETHMSDLRNLNIDHKTRLTQMAVKLLQSNNIVVIQGNPGVGKTHIALNALMEMTDSVSSLKTLIFCNPTVNKVEELIDISNRYLLLFVDFLGIINIERTQVSDWNRYIAALLSYIKCGKVFVVITIRKNIQNKCSNESVHTIFNKVWTLDLDESTMNVDEKRNMLNNYAEHFDIDISKLDIEKVIKETIYGVGFPLLCRVMKGKNVLNLFTRPVEVLKEDILCMSEKDNAGFVCLLMTMFCDETFKTSQLDDHETKCFEQIKEFFGANTLNKHAMQTEAQSLLQTYLRIKEDGSYTCVHDTILEAIFKAAIVTLPEIVIQYCPLKTIVTFSNTLREGETNRTYLLLLKRFKETCILVKLAQEIKIIAGSPLWQQSDFIKVAIQVISPEMWYQEDDSTNSLVVYFAGYGYIGIIEAIENEINKKPSIISISHKKIQKEKTLKEACLRGKSEIVKYLISSRIPITEESMFATVKGGSVEVLELLLDVPEVPDIENTTVLHKASQMGHLEVVKYLCNKYSSLIKMTDNNNHTAARAAAAGGQLECLVYLIEQGVDPMATSSTGKTKLHAASYNGHLDVVEYLCNKHSSLINMTDNNNNTAAHEAAAGGQLECLVYLIEQDVDPMAINSAGSTTLHAASYNGHLKVVKCLCNKYSSLIKMTNNNNHTAARVAAERGQLECLVYLVEQGVDPMTTSSSGRTTLHAASYNGHLEVVKYLCNKHSSLIKMTDDNKNTAAHDAAEGGQLKCLVYLIQQGIDPMATSSTGSTTLHAALHNGYMEVVKYLCNKYRSLIKNADVNDNTAAHYAAAGGQLECLVYLIGQGVDPMATNSSGSTVLHAASYNGHLEVVKYLCNKYSSLINMTDDYNNTAAHCATAGGQLACLDYLIEQGVDPMATSSSGSTTLHAASYNGHLEVVKYLCTKYSSLIKMTDDNNNTAAHYAAEGGQLACLVYLIEQGVDPMATNFSGSTILHAASYNGRLEIVKYLCNTYSSLINMTDDNNNTAAHYAADGGQLECSDYLKEQGVDPTATRSAGSTTLHAASNNGHL